MTSAIRSGIDIARPDRGCGAPIAIDGALANTTSIWAFDPPILRAGEVHVWFAAADPESSDTEPLAALLDQGERDRADRFVFAHHREQFVRAHGFMRLLLGAYTRRPPAALSFTTGPFGKPQLVEPARLSFSLSHSGDGVALALGHDIPVGIDIETSRVMDDQDDLVERFFSTREIAAYWAVAPSQRDVAFFRLWTRKEAFVKGIGLGLSRPLDSFTVGLMIPAQLEAPEGDSWSLYHLAPGDGFVGAVAVLHPEPMLRGGRLSF